MKLFSRAFGEGENALLILPGLLGSSANWQSIAKRLGQRRAVYALDMRNHGQSPWSDRMDYPAMAEDVLDFITGLDHQSISLLGHSMGGKAAMRLALSAPREIDSLIVADIAPVPYEHDFEELIEPMLALDLSRYSSRSQADAALQASVAEASIRAFLLHNLGFDSERKRYYWRPNLEVLLQNMHNITGFELGPGEHYDRPTLFIYGTGSNYVSGEHGELIARYFPAARFEGLEGAGHWLHAEQPRAFIHACEAFFDMTTAGV